MRLSRSCVVIAVASLLLNTPALADPVEDFYKGKSLNLAVGFTVGGGYDLYARLVGRHIGRFIPGKPTVVVRNVPGAGGITGMNYMATQVAPDGLCFVTAGMGAGGRAAGRRPRSPATGARTRTPTTP